MVYGRFESTGDTVSDAASSASDAAMQDAPLVVKGPKIKYGGGCVIVAAMAERLTGRSYASLLQEHVYDKLGMSHSGIGRIATIATPDGVWLHTAGMGGKPIPAPSVTSKAMNFHSHNPDGAIVTTARDMGRFITANLPGKPKTSVTDDSLTIAQERPDLAETPYARGGWSGSGTMLQHNGVNNVLWADLRVYPSKLYGVAAMTNVGGSPASSAVAEMLGVLEEMHASFGLFG